MCNSKRFRSSWILQLFLIKTPRKLSVVPWEEEGHLPREADAGILSKVRLRPPRLALPWAPQTSVYWPGCMGAAWTRPVPDLADPRLQRGCHDY